jgi:Secretion system C-terminal sorting domain
VARALPVKLISFTAAKEGRQAQLAWSTSEEVNSEKFDVERSIDGKKWSQIGSLPAGGDVLNAVTRYNFTDSDPVAGENLYRLKMVDRDQTFSYSRIVNLNFKTESVVSTYPNPASDKIMIAANEWENVKTVRIVNTAGQVVYSSDKPRQEIDIQALASGSYIIGLVRDNGTQENVKFVKEAGK